MEYRINTRIIVLVAILVVIAIGLFTYTFVSAPAPEETPVTEENPASQTEERIITARHQYLEGIHTIAGVATVPTPCHRILGEPYILPIDTDPKFVSDPAGSYAVPNGLTVEVRFSTLLEGEECPAQATDVPFRVTFEAPENATITAVWDGAPVRLNLVPLGPGEILEDELYIKG
jgi:hypothetical protein